MNLLSAVEQLAVSDCSGVRLNPSRCVRKLDKTAACTLCVDACPVGAIRLEQPIALDQAACVRCGLCLHLCPVDAFAGEDGVSDLLTCVSRLETASAIELTCAVHPEPESGPAGVDAVIRVNGCLGSLGSSAYVGLLALDVEKITVRLDACAQCPFGMARQNITHVISTANAILSACGKVDRIVEITESAFDAPVQRPVTDAVARPLSRRDIFRFAAAGRSQVANHLRDDTEAVSSTDKKPPQERRRLIKALRQLAESPGKMPPPENPPPLPFVNFTVDDTCTACADCVKSCPTGAITLTVERENKYKLIFSPANCTDCDLCLAFCQPGALRREPLSSLANILPNLEPVTLREGILQHCVRCGIQFAGETATRLCPRCDFRYQNPFGRRLSAH